MKQIWLNAALGISLLLMVILLVPALLVKQEIDVPKLQLAPKVQLVPAQAGSFSVPVLLTKEHRVEQVELEAYVRGVLAAEMPADFEPEALKAQAIAARTYLVRRYVKHDFSDVGMEGAWVTDTVKHQAYLTLEQMKKNWGRLEYAGKLDRITRAVNETKGQIITHQGEPIDAAFFSTSNGYTENSEEYWTSAQPYLRSVPSPWDVELSPKYKSTIAMDKREFLSKLGLPDSIPASAGLRWMKAVERTAGKRIKSITVGNRTFTGREVREKLKLPSSHFIWKLDGSQIRITTYGNGHGVGMSQWGANGMAKEGKRAEDIIHYYYQQVEIGDSSKFIKLTSN